MSESMMSINCYWLHGSQEFEDDQLLLAALQEFEVKTASKSGPSKTDNPQFEAPRSSVDIEEVKDSRVPKKTKVNTS